MEATEGQVIQVMMAEAFSRRDEYESDSLYFQMWDRIINELDRLAHLIHLREKWKFVTHRKVKE